jgi:chorismate synthase
MTDKNDSDIGERAVAEINTFLRKSRSLSADNVRSIAEQLRVEAMLARTTRHRRRIFDALADYYEHAAEERAEEEKEDGDGIGGAVRALVENLEDDD